MSNEYKDWLRDQAEEAKEWVTKYPFLRIKTNDCYPWEDEEDIESCWIFDLPVGWQNGFGSQMCDELMAVLGKYADDFLIIQLKEKFNEMRLYWGWIDREYTDEESEEIDGIYDAIKNIINKYEEISYNTCVSCGNQATEYTKSGWYQGFCKTCYDRMNDYD